MKKILDNIIGLKRYFTLAFYYKNVPKEKLLSSTEALKAFGKIGNEYVPDVMMMIASIEYEFGRDYNYTPEQIVAVKDVLAKVMKFMTECGKEWKEYEAKHIDKQ